jgi:hypothetical protein
MKYEALSRQLSAVVSCSIMGEKYTACPSPRIGSVQKLPSSLLQMKRALLLPVRYYSLHGHLCSNIVSIAEHGITAARAPLLAKWTTFQ